MTPFYRQNVSYTSPPGRPASPDYQSLFTEPWCKDYRRGRACCPIAASTSISPSCGTRLIGETLTSIMDLTSTMSPSLDSCALAAEPPAFCPLLLAIRQLVGNLSYQAIGLTLCSGGLLRLGLELAAQCELDPKWRKRYSLSQGTIHLNRRCGDSPSRVAGTCTTLSGLAPAMSNSKEMTRAPGLSWASLGINRTFSSGSR